MVTPDSKLHTPVNLFDKKLNPSWIGNEIGAVALSTVSDSGRCADLWSPFDVIMEICD